MSLNKPLKPSSAILQNNMIFLLHVCDCWRRANFGK